MDRTPPPGFPRTGPPSQEGGARPCRPLLNPKELAEHLGVTLGLVYRMSSDGRIPKVRIGHRTVRFDLDAVLARLQDGSPVPQDRPTPRIPVQPREPDLPEYDWSSQPSPHPRGKKSVADRHG